MGIFYSKKDEPKAPKFADGDIVEFVTDLKIPRLSNNDVVYKSFVVGEIACVNRSSFLTIEGTKFYYYIMSGVDGEMCDVWASILDPAGKVVK